MSDFAEKMKTFVRTPLFKVILIGLLIRILMIPLCHPYDSNFWTIVIRNAESGYGLYQMEGYYYTPVWGYVLTFVAGVQNLLFDIGDLSVVCYDLFPYLLVEHYAYSNMAISIVFLFNLKVILTISDLVTSLLLYKIVKDRTGDEKKALIAFILMFLCPHIIGASSMVTMPDTISAMFTLMTIILIKEDKHFFAGICYAVAVWVKFFPLAIIIILFCYIYASAKDDRKLALRRIAFAFIGFMLATLIIFLPQIMEGTLIDSLDFITSRIAEVWRFGLPAFIAVAIGAVAIVVAMVFIGRHMIHAEGNIDDRMMEYCLVFLSACMLLYIYTNLQYLVTLMPFLVYCLLVSNYRYKYVWGLLAAAGIVLTFTLDTNAAMLNSLVAFTNIISSDFAVSMFDFFNDEVFFGEFSVADVLCLFGNTAQRLCFVLILAIFFGCRIMEKRRRSMDHSEND